jgi:hypothetical protein
MLELITFIVGFISGMYVVTQLEKGIERNIKKENYENFVKKHYKKKKDD